MDFGARFLHYPDLFPNRRGGEPWGVEAVSVDFVGGPYRFAGLSPAQARAVRERFGPLAVSASADAGDGEPPVAVDLFRVGAGEFRALDLKGWSYTFDRDYQPAAVRLAGLDFLGRVDFEPAPRGALWTPLGEPEPGDATASFQCQLENFFRLLVAYRLLERGGVLLHSAGVASNGAGGDARGGAFVFFGPSGAGKTTISRLGRDAGYRVLSDDMNALCPDGDGFVVEKLPFAGDLGRTPGRRSRHPLRALCRLRQGSDAVRPLAPARAVAQLLACAPFVNGDPHRLDRLSDNLVALARRVGVYELTFSLDGGCWPRLEALAPGSAAAGP